MGAAAEAHSMGACRYSGTRSTPECRCADLLACSGNAFESRPLCWPSASAEDGTMHCSLRADAKEWLTISVIDQFGDGAELLGAAERSA